VSDGSPPSAIGLWVRSSVRQRQRQLATRSPESPRRCRLLAVVGARCRTAELDGFGGGIQKSAYTNLIVTRNHEVQHVQFLRAGLGSAAVGPATSNFAKALRNVGSFLATARLLENRCDGLRRCDPLHR
jgi:hypothetical protein